jgi:serine/threonine protein kinase
VAVSSLWQCPECKRSYREGGFCPYDGKRLEGSDRVTLDSAQQTAQPQHTIENPTELDEPRTLPLPGTPSKSTQFAGSTPSAPPPGRSEPPTSIARPIKAPPAPDVHRAIEQMRAEPHRTEYDRLVGEVLENRYRILRKIGEGGMGVVFAAKHNVIERPLAIKVLKREVMRDAGTIRRFVQEAKAASRIGHPNIVDVTDFGQTEDGLAFSVMEYIEGQTLSAAIRHGAPFHIARALRIAAQIARALGSAHDKGIVHRDLKPENVFLLDRDGRPDFVKIVDFGIAKVAPVPGDPNQPRLTKAGAVFGTPEYMAPEQAAGRGDTDGRVDVYALGVILYEMIVGKVPHRGETMVRTLAMQMLDAVVPPTVVRPDLGIPPEVEGVVMKALAKKRENRFQTMGELLDSMDHLAREVLPPPVAQNAAGSALYALAPLPPGADPSIQPLLPPAQMMQAVMPPGSLPPSGAYAMPSADYSGVGPVPASMPPPATGSRAAIRPASPSAAQPISTPTQRKLHEPAFVGSGHLPVFEPDQAAPPTGSRLPILLGAILGIGAITAGAIVALSRHDDQPTPPQPPTADAGVLAHVPTDGGVIVQVPADALDDVLVDADAVRDAAIVHNRPPRDGGVIVVQRGDAGPGPGSGGDGSGVVVFIDPSTHRGTVAVQIVTKPDTARLYVGTTYRGPGGTTMEEAAGTVLDVECREAGYKSGRIRVAFDGRTEVELCAMTRIKICIDNIKNPFDDCEVDPSRPSPDRSVNGTAGSGAPIEPNHP